MKTIYLELTEQFNKDRFRAIICSGQAVVLHKLAIMSKDGDWIVREDQEALDHIIQVLASHKASYRFGAPLDVRWMSSGWSAQSEWQAYWPELKRIIDKLPLVEAHHIIVGHATGLLPFSVEISDE